MGRKQRLPIKRHPLPPTQTPTILRIGVIGAGWPGERHTEGFTASGDAEVIAVSDLETTRREAFAARYHVPKQYEVLEVVGDE